MNRTHVLALLLLQALLFAACGGGRQEAGATLPDDGFGKPLIDAGAPAEAAAPAPPGTIRRSDLDKVLAAGPASALARVETAPYRENDAFLGFQIARFVGDPPAAIDLRAGDVILTVNGRKVERPEDYYTVWEDLKRTKALRFEILRGKERVALEYPIVD